MKSQQIAYIILSFILTSLFISIFFFTYVADTESEIIKDQINKVISDFVSSTNLFLSPDQKTQVGKIIMENLSVPDMSNADRTASKTNSNLLKKTMIAFGILIGLGLISILAMWYKYRFEFDQMIKHSIIILCLVAITEILFVTLVTKNYRLIDENYLSYLILTNLQNYANSKL